MKTIIIFIILGVVQGITEPLPISSSGHIIIAQTLFNFQIPGASFEAFVNFGSTIAILVYFRNKIKELVYGVIVYFISVVKKIKSRDDNKKLKKLDKIQKQYKGNWDYFLKIIVASIPLGVFGIIIVLLGYDGVENIKVIGGALLITAISLFIVSNFSGKKGPDEITYRDALIIGMFQAVAFLPGISRSGMTLIGAILVGIKSKDAFDFSFMMYIPASVAALLFSIIQILTSGDIIQYFIGYILAFLMAGIFTWLSLIVLQKVVIANKLYYFGIYCFIMSVSIIFFI